MNNMITNNAKFVKIDNKYFLHSMKCIEKHTKKCDHCIKLCKNRSFTSRLEAIQIIKVVLEIFSRKESAESRDIDLETVKKFVRSCKLNQARCDEKLLASKVSIKITAITSLLKLKEELLAIGIFVSETNKISAVFSQQTQCFNFRSFLLITKKTDSTKISPSIYTLQITSNMLIKITAYTIFIFSQGNYVSQIRRT